MLVSELTWTCNATALQAHAMIQFTLPPIPPPSVPQSSPDQLGSVEPKMMGATSLNESIVLAARNKMFKRVKGGLGSSRRKIELDVGHLLNYWILYRSLQCGSGYPTGREGLSVYAKCAQMRARTEFECFELNALCFGSRNML